jgi:hypothetical protein
MESQSDPEAVIPSPKDIVLALEIRPQKFGFVVFEGPARLLDWGVKSFRGLPNQHQIIAAKRIGDLVRLYSPSVIVTRRRKGARQLARRVIRLPASLVRKEAHRDSIRLAVLSTRTIRQHFADLGFRTKHQIATSNSHHFEELSWKLRPKRKAWQSETSSTVIFDAAATGVAFFGQPRPADAGPYPRLENEPGLFSGSSTDA